MRREIEWSIQGIISVPNSKKIGCVSHIQKRDLAAALAGGGSDQGHSQGELVVVRDEPALNGVAYRLPPLVVLIEDVTALDGAIFVNDQESLAKKRKAVSPRLKVV